MHTVPLTSSGLTGWTSCCDAAVTCDEYGDFCCKACWNTVHVKDVDDVTSRKLDAIVRSVLKQNLTPDQGVMLQHELLATAWHDFLGRAQGGA
jgi:hypothetical protein